MASTATILGQNVASIISGSGHLSVQTEFERLQLDDAPLVSWFGYGSPVKVQDNFKFQWIKDRALSTKLTTTVNIVTADVAITMSTTDTASLQVGHMLSIGTEVMRVTVPSATSTTTTVVRTLSGVSATTWTTGTTVRVLSPSMLDGAAFTEAPTILGEFEYNYPQLIPYEFSETGLRAGMVNYLTKGQNELDFHTAEANRMSWQIRQLENSCLWGQRAAPTGATVASTFGGVFQYVTSNVTTASGLLTATNIEDTIDAIFAWDNGSNGKDLAAVMTRNTARIFSAIMRQYFEVEMPQGTRSASVFMDTYQSALATIKVLVSQSMPDNKILLLRKGDIQLRPLDMDNFGTGWMSFERNPKETNAVSKQRGYYGAFTLVVGDERRHGLIQSFTTTPASYAGAV